MRYQRMGVNPNLMREELNLKLLATSDDSNFPAYNINVVLSGRIRNRTEAALMYLLRDEAERCVEYARKIPLVAEEYFFGSWRREIKPNARTGLDLSPEQWWRQNWSWMKQYRLGVAWAACLGDWEQVKLLSSFPDDDCTDESSFTDYKLPDRAWYILLAKRLRGDRKTPAAPYAKTIEAGGAKGRRAGLLLAVGQSIWAKDQPALSAALDEYLSFFKKREFGHPEGGLERCVAMDASLLVHLAEREGLEAPVAKKYEDYIVRLPQTKGV